MPPVYDRRVSPAFLSHFVDAEPADDHLGETLAGGLASLVRYAQAARYPVDLQFRHGVSGGRDWATLYVGLTKVLDVRSTKKGLLSLHVHPTHAKTGRFDETWSVSMKPGELMARWADVELYLDRIIPAVTLTHAKKEGAVQVALSSFDTAERVVFDRETTPSFADTGEKKAFLEQCAKPIQEALDSAGLEFKGRPLRLGNECDALAVDRKGRLLAVEVKPQGVGSVAFVAAQALMYAQITRGWVEEVGDDHALTVVNAMIEQRIDVGLASIGSPRLSAPVDVVPVVAIQRGSSPEMVRRMLAVRDAVASVDPELPAVEIYEITLLGDLVALEESRLPDGRPRSQNFAAAMNARMIAWKKDPASPLPAEARGSGVVKARNGELVEVDYALPKECATHNLLPEVRDQVMEIFAAQGITWHQGKDAPTPHLRSSQVQCLNALGAMTSDAERIAAAFGSLLDIASVRDLGVIDADEAGRYLTFEFTGSKDYFGESKSGSLTRGSYSTSVDAAFAYTTTDGHTALALLEWKFTETYPSADRNADRKFAERSKRYGEALADADGPIRVEELAKVDVLFHEPIYQLVRQQLLANKLQRDLAVDADVVRVVHISPPANRAYQQSYIHPELRRRGTNVSEVWTSLLRDPSTFVSMSSEAFLDPNITSESYRHRYGPATE